MIAVCLVTYNQEEFIAQAIESVLAQKNCPYPIRLYIGNDASKDRTGEICKSFAVNNPQRICLINQETNMGLVRNTLSVLDRIRKDGSDYIAMLDGDDYWCDDEKLMKQASFLDNHIDYGLISSRVYLLTNQGLKKQTSSVPPTGDVFNQIDHYPVGGSSVFYRSSLLNLLDFTTLSNRGFLSLDYVMYTIFSSQTSFGFLEDYTTVWRRNIPSVSNPKDKTKQIAYLENDRAMWRYLGELFPQRFHYDETAWKKYYDDRVFQLAFKYGDYELAHQMLPSVSGRGRHLKIKRICAKNKLLFYLWKVVRQALRGFM